MKTISLAMIVKNEQAVIERLLKNARSVFDEIIIVDTGSNDDTERICSQYGKVYHYQWCNDFSKARNYAFSLAKSQYIMWLDADDILQDKDCQLIKQWKMSQSTPDTVLAKYITATDEQGNATFWYYRERIVRNCDKAVWQGQIHEAISVFGVVEYAEFAVNHSPIGCHTKRNLSIFRKMLRQGQQLDTRLLYYYGRELYYSRYFSKAEKVFRQYLNRPDGYIADKAEVYKVLSIIYTTKGNIKKAREQLILAIQFCGATSEICCMLGDSYLSDDLNTAKQWYIFALNCLPQRYGFVNETYSLYYPAMQLCMVCDKLGQLQESYHYHLMVKEKFAYRDAVIHNEKYFQYRLNGKKL